MKIKILKPVSKKGTITQAQADTIVRRHINRPKLADLLKGEKPQKDSWL